MHNKYVESAYRDIDIQPREVTIESLPYLPFASRARVSHPSFIPRSSKSNHSYHSYHSYPVFPLSPSSCLSHRTAPVSSTVLHGSGRSRIERTARERATEDNDPQQPQRSTRDHARVETEMSETTETSETSTSSQPIAASRSPKFPTLPERAFGSRRAYFVLPRLES